MAKLFSYIAPNVHKEIAEWGEENITDEFLESKIRETKLAYEIFKKENAKTAEFIENRIKDAGDISDILVLTGIAAAGKKIVGGGIGNGVFKSDNFVNGGYKILLPKQETGNFLTLVLKDGKFKNQIGLSPSKIKKLPSPTGFILTKEGKLIFGEEHSFISKGVDVRYAGEIKFSNGKIKQWTNGSGHYKPNINDLEGINLVKSKFQDLFNVELGNITKYVFINSN